MRLRLLFGALLAPCIDLLGARAAYAQAEPSTPPATQDQASAVDAMATSNAWVAAIALLMAAAICAGILVLVNRAHLAQREIALGALTGGGSVLVATATAAGGPELQAAKFAVTGPTELVVNQVGVFKVPDTGPPTAWTIQGIDVYGSAEKENRTLLFTPHEVKTGVTVTASDGTARASIGVKILSAPAPVQGGATPLTVRFVVRNWGLVLVSVLIVLGAVALAVAGQLDGGNFVALVAPLAALLGVTAISGGADGRAQGDQGEKPRGGGTL